MTIQQSSVRTSMFGEWLKVLVENNGNNPVTAGNIKDTLRKNLIDEFEKLGQWLVDQESTEIGNYCGERPKWPRNSWRSSYMKVLCTAIGEIRYFISGVRKVRKYYGATEDRDPDVTTLTPAEAYARCIVSAVALAEIYGDHCNMKEAIDEVEGAFEQKIRGHLEGKDGKPGRSNQLDVCEGINATDLMVGKAVLGNAIKQWTKEKRNLRYSGGWRVGRQWAERWPHVCRRGKGEEEAKNKAKEENKNILTPFLKVGTDNSIATSGQNNMSTLGDILMNDDMKLPENTLENVLQVVIKDGKVNALKIDEVVQNLQNAAQEEIMEVQKLNELKELLQNITDDKKWDNFSKDCNDDIGSSWSKDTEGEKTAKQKACKLFASGLKHISDIKKDNGQDPDVPLRKTMMCAALNLYADQLISKATNQCPLDNKKLEEAIKYAFEEGNATMNGKSKCTTGSGNSCFECKRQDSSTFGSCQIGKDKNDKVKPQLESLLEKNDETNPNNKEKTLNKINEIESFCTQVQCAIKQHYAKKNNKKTDPNGTVTWSDINEDAKGVLMTLLEQMTKEQTKGDLAKYCNDDNKWSKFGHKGKHTNKAACLLFAAGLKNIYVRGKGQVKGPSFGQTMGCLFLKEYAKQLKDLANKKKRGNSWVHPLCDIDEGIKHAFKQSKDIMRSVLSQCNNGTDGTSCFECTIDKDYNKCSIGTDEVKSKVESIYQDESKQNQMQQTLENTVCPILLTDLLTPFLPLAPVSIGLSAMAYYLWKYFGPLGKGGARFRRSPAEIRGPSVQEQVLDHVEEAGPHEYRLVKERKPRSAPTRTKRSGPVNRRTIIEIHFEVLDECQKGDTQLNQKDFLELLIQEFMGSELMESEQVPKEEVLMESIPMELLPIEEVPSLGSGFMV
ncbi:SICAvar, type I [Plasmodium knowlesi strain H]|uniref:SICAvar, type I n=1 Tax=Plasmodium knowlesi (strain H) TaxID=5851 RepID=A0A679L5C3_PLAKH|nr:SICAvar, type I [Plasmodium knowlesi strain H]CAA9988804.1 SICAvar, type I [Plasmodium knowlesi strain H]VVS78278.1 SICAvar, type I [Plasmodium knowlesi strain H]